MMDHDANTPTPDSPHMQSELNADANPARAMIASSIPHRTRVTILCAIVLSAVVAISFFLYFRRFEETDDAQVDAHLAPISSRIEGTASTVLVEDNTYVHVGQLLIELDGTDNEVALRLAKARYEQALAQQQAHNPNVLLTEVNTTAGITSLKFEIANGKAALAAAEHNVSNAEAQLRQAEAVDVRAQADYQRYKDLYEKHEVARAQFQNFAATASAQTAIVDSFKSTIASARKVVEQRKAELADQENRLSQAERTAPEQVTIERSMSKSHAASVEAAKAALAQAQLNLQYVHIRAPVAGYITQRSVEVGSQVGPGQQLLMIVQTDDLWITANFKETQLSRMRAGQSVTVHVDALNRDFTGKIESMPAITGSRSSVLPPENATGNFVKVVQRLPVRIRLERDQAGYSRLRPGMSAEATVHID